MDATTTPRLARSGATDAAPHCPRCRRAMVLRAGRRLEPADLYWGCSRAPACAGRRRVDANHVLHPHASDASVQAIFEWERAHDRGSANRRRGFAQVRNTGARVVAVAGRVLPRRDASAPGRADRRDGRAATRANPVPSSKPAATALAGLVEHGYVILDDRWLPFARARLDHVVIGPAGLFVIESRAWPGQLGITDNELFVDGRRRIGATEEVLRTTAAVEEALAHELKPLGAPVKSVLCIWRATPQWFKGSVRGVLVTNGRALARAIREGEQVLGPETVVRLALAADRLLE